VAQQITVKVSGCVREPGDYSLSVRACVNDAIFAAKNFARKPYPSAGIITIRSRRKKDGRYYRRRRFDIQTTDMRSVALRDRDIILVQYEVDA
jgi:hypothetical protein